MFRNLERRFLRVRHHFTTWKRYNPKYENSKTKNNADRLCLIHDYIRKMFWKVELSKKCITEVFLPQMFTSVLFLLHFFFTIIFLSYTTPFPAHVSSNSSGFNTLFFHMELWSRKVKNSDPTFTLIRRLRSSATANNFLSKS